MVRSSAQGQLACIRSVAVRAWNARRAGDVHQPVAQTLGLAAGEFAGEQQALGPAEQVVSDPHELEPDTVVLEIAEWQVAHAGVLVVADVILDSCAAAVLALEMRRCHRTGR